MRKLFACLCVCFFMVSAVHAGRPKHYIGLGRNVWLNPGTGGPTLGTYNIWRDGKGGLDWFDEANPAQDGLYHTGDQVCFFPYFGATVDLAADYDGLYETWTVTIQEKNPANGEWVNSYSINDDVGQDTWSFAPENYPVQGSSPNTYRKAGKQSFTIGIPQFSQPDATAANNYGFVYCRLKIENKRWAFEDGAWIQLVAETKLIEDFAVYRVAN